MIQSTNDSSRPSTSQAQQIHINNGDARTNETRETIYKSTNISSTQVIIAYLRRQYIWVY